MSGSTSARWAVWKSSGRSLTRPRLCPHGDGPEALLLLFLLAALLLLGDRGVAMLLLLLALSGGLAGGAGAGDVRVVEVDVVVGRRRIRGEAAVCREGVEDSLEESGA